MRHRELRLLGLKFGQVLTLLTVSFALGLPHSKSRISYVLCQTIIQQVQVSFVWCSQNPKWQRPSVGSVDVSCDFVQYLDITVQQMREAWEDILMEMDSKLMKFAEEKQKVCGGSVSNDFLRLLMVGKPRCAKSLCGFTNKARSFLLSNVRWKFCSLSLSLQWWTSELLADWPDWQGEICWNSLSPSCVKRTVTHNKRNEAFRLGVWFLNESLCGVTQLRNFRAWKSSDFRSKRPIPTSRSWFSSTYKGTIYTWSRERKQWRLFLVFNFFWCGLSVCARRWFTTWATSGGCQSGMRSLECWGWARSWRSSRCRRPAASCSRPASCSSESIRKSVSQRGSWSKVQGLFTESFPSCLQFGGQEVVPLVYVLNSPLICASWWGFLVKSLLVMPCSVRGSTDRVSFLSGLLMAVWRTWRLSSGGCTLVGADTCREIFWSLEIRQEFSFQRYVFSVSVIRGLSDESIPPELSKVRTNGVILREYRVVTGLFHRWQQSLLQENNSFGLWIGRIAPRMKPPPLLRNKRSKRSKVFVCWTSDEKCLAAGNTLSFPWVAQILGDGRSDAKSPTAGFLGDASFLWFWKFRRCDWEGDCFSISAQTIARHTTTKCSCFIFRWRSRTSCLSHSFWKKISLRFVSKISSTTEPSRNTVSSCNRGENWSPVSYLQEMVEGKKPGFKLEKVGQVWIHGFAY